MDPQNRLLLEQTFVALGEAQPRIGSLADTKTGVYVGCMYQVPSREKVRVHDLPGMQYSSCTQR